MITLINGKRHCAASPSKHKLPALLPLCKRGMHVITSSLDEINVFVQFDLVDKKELAPLDELNDAILAEDKGR